MSCKAEGRREESTHGELFIAAQFMLILRRQSQQLCPGKASTNRACLECWVAATPADCMCRIQCTNAVCIRIRSMPSTSRCQTT